MGGDARDRRKWWILASMGAILGVILLDETVVGVALPTIQTDLDMSEVASHWVVNVYMLVLAGIAAAAGKLGDIIGHRALMTIGLLVFGLASLASGFSENGAWLIAARGVQGVGAAIIFPSSLAMVTITFPEAQRGMALGIYGSIGTVFLAAGPAVGGFLTDDVSWRWIFWINPPIVVLVAVIVLAAWRDLPAMPEKRLDVTGAVLLVTGLAMIVFALMEGPGWGWSDPAILLLLALGVLLLLAFVLVERRVAGPLLDVTLFANPTFAGCNLVIFSAQYSKMAVFVFGALYLQDILKMSPLAAGLALLPAVAPQIVTATLAGVAADRFGARWPSLIALMAMGGGLCVIAVAIAVESYTVMFPGLLAWGLSLAFLFVAPERAVMNAVPPVKHGQASGIALTSQLLGATIGMALCSTLFVSANAFAVVFWVNAAVTGVVFVVGWLTIERPHPATAAATG